MELSILMYIKQNNQELGQLISMIMGGEATEEEKLDLLA